MSSSIIPTAASTHNISSNDGIPYDKPFGTGSVCWWEDARLAKCPSGNSVSTSMLLHQHDHDAEAQQQILRTGTVYNYSTQISLNWTSLLSVIHADTTDTTSTSSDNIREVAVSIIACAVGLSGGSCNPFTVQEFQQQVHHVQDDTQQQQQVLQSPWVRLELSPHQNQNSEDLYQFTTAIPFPIESPGDYTIIVALQLNLTTIATIKSKQQSTFQFDMSNALQPTSVLSFQKPPTVLTVTQGVRITGYVLIAIASSILIWLLQQSWQYQGTSALQITQGQFLMVFLLAGLLACTSAVLLDPYNDTYCRYGSPMVLCSFQLFFAITLGRVWRINAIVSPAMMKLNRYHVSSKEMDKQDSASAGWWKHAFRSENWNSQRLLFDPIRILTSTMVRFENQYKPKSLRKSITNSQLAMVIALFTMPQVLLQIFGVIFQPQQLSISFNDDFSVGRQHCAATSGSRWTSVQFFGILLFVGLLIALLFMAQSTRKLPSLFNESKLIFHSVLFSVLVLAIGVIVMLATATESGAAGANPSVEYMVLLIMIISATLQASLRMLIPKLTMAWRNEQIVVSELVCAHSRLIRLKQSARESERRQPQQQPHSSPPPRTKNRSRDDTIDSEGQSHSQATAHQNDQWWASSVESANSSNGDDSNTYISSSGNKFHDSNDSSIWSHALDRRRTNGDEFSSSLSTVPGDRGARYGLAASITAFDTPIDEALQFDGSQDTFTRVDTEIGGRPTVETAEENDDDDDVESDDEENNNSVDIANGPLLCKDEPETNDLGSERKTSVHFSEERAHPERLMGPRRRRRSYKSPRVHRSITVSTHRPPEWKLLLKMMDMQKHLEHVSGNIMSGKPVSQDDWEDVRAMTSRLGHIFQEEVLFEWETTTKSKTSSLEIIGGQSDAAELEMLPESPDGHEEPGNDTVNSLLNASLTSIPRKSSILQSTSLIQFYRTPREKLLDPECNILEMLSDGPLRFAPNGIQRPIDQQVRSLPKEEQRVYRLLQTDWKDEREKKKLPVILSNEMILRFLRHSEGVHADSRQLAAWRAMKNFHLPYMSLRSHDLESQIYKSCLFPIPGVKTLQGGNDVFYMRPCRYDPRVTSTSVVIDNLVYCMSTMLEKESSCTDGIGFVACMDGWTMKHFSMEYCFQFMQGLQGKLTPVNVVLFLIVNPPTWFGKVWKVMKPMLSTEFQKKVKMIPECQLDEYLEEGFETYLPDDMATGEANTDNLVKDWFTYRNFLESDCVENSSSSSDSEYQHADLEVPV